jgi:hypothetical protein
MTEGSQALSANAIRPNPYLPVTTFTKWRAARKDAAKPDRKHFGFTPEGFGNFSPSCS